MNDMKIVCLLPEGFLHAIMVEGDEQVRRLQNAMSGRSYHPDEVMDEHLAKVVEELGFGEVVECVRLKGIHDKSEPPLRT